MAHLSNARLARSNAGVCKRSTDKQKNKSPEAILSINHYFSNPELHFSGITSYKHHSQVLTICEVTTLYPMNVTSVPE